MTHPSSLCHTSQSFKVVLRALTETKKLDDKNKTKQKKLDDTPFKPLPHMPVIQGGA